MNDNKEFIWDDESVFEFALQVKVAGTCEWVKPQMEEFKLLKSKEVSNKDYEIVAYINVPQQLIYVKTATDKFVYEKDSTYQIHEPEKCANLFIYSVKRLSDNSVWTLGDLDSVGSGIERFAINDKSERVVTVYFHNKKNGTYYNMALNGLSKAKERVPLFTTEDGKDIFEGDRCWYMTEDFRIDFYDFNVYSHREHDLRHYSDYKYFSTEEKAKLYVLMNKPINFSIDKLADTLAIWSWGKEIPTEMFAFGKFIKRGLIEIQEKINDKV